MEKITIVFLLGQLEYGGTEGQILELLRGLNRERFEPKVLAFPHDGELRQEIEALSIPFTGLGFSGLRGLFHPGSSIQLYGLIRAMVRYFRREKPRIVQSYLFWANIYGSIAAKIAGVPIIITGRRGLVEEQGLKPHYRWLRNLSNAWATVVVTNSEFVRQYCLQHEQYLSPAKMRLIYNGVTLSRYATISSVNATVAKQTLGLPASATIVGIVANLRSCKGHQIFLKAAAHVIQILPQTRFLVVGRDEGILADLERLSGTLGLSQMAVFTGERHDIPELLALCDLLVSASLTESFSNAILEGMAAGKPIVATAVGGTTELVRHEQTGILVPPNNASLLAEAMLRVLGDRELRRQLGNNGQFRAATLFPTAQMVAQTEALYQELDRRHG